MARAERDDSAVLPPLRELADRMFSRAAGAPLIGGNQVRLLEDGRENYPAWLAAIRAAKDHVHFENYFIQDDEIGQEFGEAFAAKAREGVRVRIVYDWLGGFAKASRGFGGGCAERASRFASRTRRNCRAPSVGCRVTTARRWSSMARSGSSADCA